MRNAEEIRIELIPNSAFRIPHFFRSLGFSSFCPPCRRLATKNGVEQGHGTQLNRLGMKDLWPSASRFWHLIKPGLKRSKTQFLTRFDPKTRG